MEPNYFFKLRAYQDWLVDHLRRNEDFIFPRFRQKQVLEFLKEPLNDLCISRPRERLEWGIPLPFDPAFVTYVWFDALVNYVSAVWQDGRPDPGRWPADFHVIGKDILAPRARRVLADHAARGGHRAAPGAARPRLVVRERPEDVQEHGQYVEPADYIAKFGVDALRYFLIREMNVGQDSDFTAAQFLSRYNSDLANDLGQPRQPRRST